MPLFAAVAAMSSRACASRHLVGGLAPASFRNRDMRFCAVRIFTMDKRREHFAFRRGLPREPKPHCVERNRSMPSRKRPRKYSNQELYYNSTERRQNPQTPRRLHEIENNLYFLVSQAFSSLLRSIDFANAPYRIIQLFGEDRGRLRTANNSGGLFF